MYYLHTAIHEFLNHCKFERNLSARSIKAYQIDLSQLEIFFKKNNCPLEVTLITKIDLRIFLESISHLKPKSIKRKVATIKSLFNYLEFEDKIIVNPLRKMRINIKEPRMLPKILSIQEVCQIFKYLYKCHNSLKDQNSYSYFTTVRDIVVFELLFATGGRVSEISNLKDDCIDLNTGVVRIDGKGGKERLIQICNPETISILKKYRKISLSTIKSKNEYFLVNRFNNKLSDQSIRNITKETSKKVGIKLNVTPHVFRHSFATLLLEKDVDIKYIQAMLGHSSIVTTQIYTHVNKEKQRQILKSKHPRRDFSINSSE